ncbi:glycine zipper 2TM domain-containing protein [Inmirania thermothiophila]|uniref:Uncharacterized protein YcfJ n=1 Tax=Inmirania thermothiophila TaxID=1750597 RepID=A0A3N1Y2K6_9GAMM|nr:hypothetical protein [Inmirania thermothiophila]ROR32771.1 uncharacterized protein YcfJ [Inmirania thermothiophila]
MNKHRIASRTLALAVAAALAAPAALARPRPVDDGGYLDWAQVERVVPIVRVVEVSTPRRVCREVVVTREEPARVSPSSAILGGIIGGAIGNQFGRGRGKDAMTVAGIALGASVGHDIARSGAKGRTHTTTEQRCEVVAERHEEEQTLGYRVVYRYRGQRYETRMDHDPGDRLRVRVSVQPVE